MSKKELSMRYLFFLVGLFVNSFGISFITKSALGTSPISSIPYTLSLGFAPTLGMFTLYMSLVLVVLQLFIMGRNFPKQYFLQLPISFLFSYFIDLSMSFLTVLDPQFYPMKLLSLLVGCAILGCGVFMEVVADVAMLPGECFVNAVSKTFHTDFGKTKIAFDTSMALIAVVISLLLYHRLEGVREGTIIAALLVGTIARTLNRKIGSRVNGLLTDDSATAPAEQPALSAPACLCSETPIIITISREYGSGGRKIAKQLAETMGLDFYDHQIITQAARQLGLSEVEVEAKEQRLGNHLLYDIMAQFYDFSEQKAAPDQLFAAEKQIILSAAQKGNCVIVGRCANAICHQFPNAYHIFLHADDDYKIGEIMQREHLDRDAAVKLVTDINKQRFNHYKYYTGRIWGLAQDYHLCIDTGKLEAEQVIGLIRAILPC